MDILSLQVMLLINLFFDFVTYFGFFVWNNNRTRRTVILSSI